MSTRHRVVVECNDAEHAKEVAQHVREVRAEDVEAKLIEVHTDVVDVLDGLSGTKNVDGNVRDDWGEIVK